MNNTNKFNGVFDRTVYHDLDKCAEGYLKLKPDYTFQDYLAINEIERFW